MSNDGRINNLTWACEQRALVLNRLPKMVAQPAITLVSGLCGIFDPDLPNTPILVTVGGATSYLAHQNDTYTWVENGVGHYDYDEDADTHISISLGGRGVIDLPHASALCDVQITRTDDNIPLTGQGPLPAVSAQWVGYQYPYGTAPPGWFLSMNDRNYIVGTLSGATTGQAFTFNYRRQFPCLDNIFTYEYANRNWRSPGLLNDCWSTDAVEDASGFPIEIVYFASTNVFDGSTIEYEEQVAYYPNSISLTLPNPL